jgi:hypothetical protein
MRAAANRPSKPSLPACITANLPPWILLSARLIACTGKTPRFVVVAVFAPLATQKVAATKNALHALRVEIREIRCTI